MGGVLAATLADYERIVADRPTKFSEREAGYTPASKNKTDYHCDECLHFYEGKIAKRNVCEIMRRNGEATIEPEANCRFWTMTGLKHPLLKESKESDGR